MLKPQARSDRRRLSTWDGGGGQAGGLLCACASAVVDFLTKLEFSFCVICHRTDLSPNRFRDVLWQWCTSVAAIYVSYPNSCLGHFCLFSFQVRTRILGRRTAPFTPFRIPNHVPHDFTQDPSTFFQSCAKFKKCQDTKKAQRLFAPS